MNYLSICCIAKDEHPFIQEWVNYHLMAGAEKIIIYDNESKPPLKKQLQKELEENTVVIIPITGQECQIPAYSHCLQEFGSISTWIAFIDMDEFIFPKVHDDLRLILADYEQFGGLGVHWVEYGSSGYVTRPLGSQIDSYIHRFPFKYPKNMHIKSIVQPRKVEKAFNPHQFIYKEPWYCVDENHFPLRESWGPFRNRKIQINHYYYRSQQDFYSKLNKGRADRADEEGRKNQASFMKQLHKAVVKDDSLAKMVARLKKNQSLSLKYNDKQQLTSKILMLIAGGKLDKAREMLKLARVSLQDTYLVNYLDYKISLKNEDYQEAIDHLYALLVKASDIYLYLDLITILIRTGSNSEAREILDFIKWRYSKTDKKDSALSLRIEQYTRELYS